MLNRLCLVALKERGCQYIPSMDVDSVKAVIDTVYYSSMAFLSISLAFVSAFIPPGMYMDETK